MNPEPHPESSSEPTTPADHPAENVAIEFHPGDCVQLAIAPPYFKTADPMPMLRPPDLIAVGEQGTILEPRPGQTWAVKFPQGVLLLDNRYLVLATETNTTLSHH